MPARYPYRIQIVSRESSATESRWKDVLTTEAVTIISLLVVAITGHSALFSEAVEAPFRLSFILALVCYLFAMQAMLGMVKLDIRKLKEAAG